MPSSISIPLCIRFVVPGYKTNCSLGMCFHLGMRHLRDNFVTQLLFRRQKNTNGLLEIKHENEDSDSQFLELRERPSFLSEDVHRLPPPRPLPTDVYTLRIPSQVPKKIEEINLNPVRFCRLCFRPVSKRLS